MFIETHRYNSTLNAHVDVFLGKRRCFFLRYRHIAQLKENKMLNLWHKIKKKNDIVHKSYSHLKKWLN